MGLWYKQYGAESLKMYLRLLYALTAWSEVIVQIIYGEYSGEVKDLPAETVAYDHFFL